MQSPEFETVVKLNFYVYRQSPFCVKEIPATPAVRCLRATPSGLVTDVRCQGKKVSGVRCQVSGKKVFRFAPVRLEKNQERIGVSRSVGVKIQIGVGVGIGIGVEIAIVILIEIGCRRMVGAAHPTCA